MHFKCVASFPFYKPLPWISLGNQQPNVLISLHDRAERVSISGFPIVQVIFERLRLCGLKTGKSLSILNL